MKPATPRILDEVLRDPKHPVSRIADGLLPYLRILVEKFHPEQVILFGSYAYGEPDEHSDVDLLIVKPMEKSAVAEKSAIRRAWWEALPDRVPPPFELLVIDPESRRRRLAEGGGFFREINERGLRIA